MDWSEALIRGSIVFIGLMIWARILGKKLISQMTFFDFVAGVAIGSIGGSMILIKDIPLYIGLLGLSVFCLWALLSDVVSLKSFFMRKVLEGEPTLIIKNGQILDATMSRIRLNMHDLLMLLRKKDVFYVDQVDTAYLETNGTLTVLKKAEYLPATRGDLNIIGPSRGLVKPVIMDGQILTNNLQSFGKDEAWIQSELAAKGITSVNNIALAQMDQLHEINVFDSENNQR
jgi:uncharacterized membrane protein YcaP (DUF421 family)